MSLQNSGLQGKVAIVTGATSGIGKATAAALAREGVKVVLTGRRVPEGTAVAEEIQKSGGTAHFVQADVSKEADVRRIVDETVRKFGRLDIAVNNAGVEVTGGVVDFDEAAYRKTFDTNVLGVFLSLKHEIPALLKSGGGSIINISSVAGNRGMPGASVYVASKFAVEGLTRSAALEYATQGIRINAIAPAVIQTPMADRFGGVPGTESRAQLDSIHPMGRSGEPREIADVVLFLASNASSFMTGATVAVDGGVMAK